VEAENPFGAIAMNLLNAKMTLAGADLALDAVPFPSTDWHSPAKLLTQCPAFKATPLTHAPALAEALGAARVHVKDERQRMGLGSFKALGAAYVIAHDATETGKTDLATALKGVTYATASAGNHGMSVAAGAALFGATAVIYIAETVPQSFAARLRDKGARVVRQGADYEASMQAAQQAADTNNWRLLSDSSWHGYTSRPHRLMEGYLQMAQETVDQINQVPTHIFLQAGVGGFAAAMAALFRQAWAEQPQIIVVEPEAAPALFASIKAGAAVTTTGPVSAMGRLDCKEPSLIALKGLARDASHFMTISEDEAAAALPPLAAAGYETTASGGAGFAGAAALVTDPNNTVTPQSRVLIFITEGTQ